MVANPDHSRKAKVPLQPFAAAGDYVVLRGFSRFVGAVLVLSAIGIWAVPVTTGDAGMVLMKLLVSVCLASVGALMVEAGRQMPREEMHLDTARRELRHVSRSFSGQARLLARYDFSELADVRLQNGALTVIATDGRVLIQLPMADLHNLPAIRQALGLSLAKAG